jgi:hypothetical protein
MNIHCLRVFFAWFRALCTPHRVKAAPANFNRRAQHLLTLGPSRACSGLGRWGRLSWTEPGFDAAFPSSGVW